MTRRMYGYALIWAAYLSADRFTEDACLIAWGKVPNASKAEARRIGRRLYECWP